MRTAMLYGLMWGIALPLFTTVAPQPEGAVFVWTVIAVQLAWAATLIWVRMGLVFSTLAMALGATEGVMVAMLYWAGYDLFGFPTPWAVLFWSGMIVVPMTLHVDMFLNPDKWEAWRRHLKTVSLWDMLRGRHIPDLRSGTTLGA